jgi:ABC-2 type transport system permease protein
MSKLLTVAGHEFSTNARRWEFLLVTIGLPLLTAALIVLASVPNYLYLRGRQMESRGVHVGVVDLSRSLAFPATFKGPSQAETLLPKSSKIKAPDLSLPQTWHLETFPSVESGERALVEKKIEYLYVFAADYPRSGSVDAVTLRRSPFDVTPRPPMAYLIREHYLRGKVPDSVMARVRLPLIETPVVLDERGRPIADPLTDQLVSLVFPYAMMALLMMALLGSSTYILRSLVEEKESRIQEVLLSSVRPADLFYGKILGLGALGLFQVGVWLVLGLPFALRFLSVLEVPGSLLATFLVYFILGYMLYAAIIAGIGAVGSTEKESNQIFAIFVLLFSSPLLFLPILLDSPDGWLPRFFSMFPFTAPLMMVMRSVNGHVAPLDLAISLALLLLAVWAAMRLSLKIFKLGLLLYGKSPTPAEIWRAVRA